MVGISDIGVPPTLDPVDDEEVEEEEDAEEDAVAFGPLLIGVTVFELFGVTVTRNWLSPEVCPVTSLTLTVTCDPLAPEVRSPSSADASCCAKELVELLAFVNVVELPEAGASVANGLNVSSLWVAETISNIASGLELASRWPMACADSAIGPVLLQRSRCRDRDCAPENCEEFPRFARLRAVPPRP